ANNTNIVNLLTQLVNLNLKLNFYTPNGINPKFITKRLAELMYNVNFIDPRLSLETIHNKTHTIVDNKVTLKDFELALKYLTDAGYKPQKISVYLLAGLYNESIEDIYKSIETISLYKVRIRLCELSVIPKTKLFYLLSLNDTIDPLFHNNTIFLFNGIPNKIKPWCNYEELQQIKNYVKSLNQKNSISEDISLYV
ncbi:MAG: radical SAM protein, partial [Endomicrobia bacterium]|nr:radical SAM protein [Endomicrobiia bacterium]